MFKGYDNIVKIILVTVPAATAGYCLYTAYIRRNHTNTMSSVKVAVASRALFDLELEHKEFKEKGVEAYLKIQKARKDIPLEQGPAFPFIKVLQSVNNTLSTIGCKSKIEVVLLSHNPGTVGVRIIDAIRAKGLPIKQMGLTDGTNPVNYLKGLKVDLFLTLYEEEVVEALQKGFAAAHMDKQKLIATAEDQLRIAFDLDAVLFGTESEKKFQELLKAYDFATAVDKYEDYEEEHSDIPLSPGPLKQFAEAFGNIQNEFREVSKDRCPIRTYIVTARGVRAGKRALRTLESWNLTINETFFLCGKSKADILSEIKPHIFFDDTLKNIKEAGSAGIAAAHVVTGTE